MSEFKPSDTRPIKDFPNYVVSFDRHVYEMKDGKPKLVQPVEGQKDNYVLVYEKQICKAGIDSLVRQSFECEPSYTDALTGRKYHGYLSQQKIQYIEHRNAIALNLLQRAKGNAWQAIRLLSRGKRLPRDLYFSVKGSLLFVAKRGLPKSANDAIHSSSRES